MTYANPPFYKLDMEKQTRLRGLGFGPTIGLLPLPWRGRHMGERPRSAIQLDRPDKDENRRFFDAEFWTGVEEFQTGHPRPEEPFYKVRSAGWDAASKSSARQFWRHRSGRPGGKHGRR